MSGTPIPVREAGDVEPRAGGRACFYQLAEHPDPERLAKAARLREAMKNDPLFKDVPQTTPRIANEIDFDERPGVVVEVNVTAEDVGRALTAAADLLNDQAGPVANAQGPAQPDGWDDVTAVSVVRVFRQGHISVDLRATAGLPREKMDALAVKVRGHIPDLPFTSPSPSEPLTSDDPCAWLNEAGAAALLGPLVVPPFRVQENSPLAAAGGNSCGYFTPGHHILTLTPRATGGVDDYNSPLALGKLVGTVAGTDDATIRGPWDKAAVLPQNTLAFLKGDSSLVVRYQLSSTDLLGAAKVAAAAMRRLAP